MLRHVCVLGGNIALTNPMKANANRCQMVQWTIMSRKKQKQYKISINVNVQKWLEHGIQFRNNKTISGSHGGASVKTVKPFSHTDNGYTHKRFSSITKYSCQWILSGTFAPQSEFAIWFTKAIFCGLSTIPPSCFASGPYIRYVTAASQVCAANRDTRGCRHWRCNWLSCSCTPVDTTRRSEAYGEEQQSKRGARRRNHNSSQISDPRPSHRPLCSHTCLAQIR